MGNKVPIPITLMALYHTLHTYRQLKQITTVPRIEMNNPLSLLLQTYLYLLKQLY